MVRAGREKCLINFCVPRGPPPHRAAEPGPPRHAKIGKNHRNQRSTAKNFKRPKNREDSSDFDDFLTKTIAPTRSRFRKNLARRSRRKRRTTSRKRRKISRKRRKISRMRRGRFTPIPRKPFRIYVKLALLQASPSR